MAPLNAVLWFTLMFHLSENAFCKTYHIAFLVPVSEDSFWNIGPGILGAIPEAVKRVNNEQTLTALREDGHNFTYEWIDTNCKASVALSALVKLWSNNHRFDVIIGGACDDVCAAVAFLAEAWNIPLISFGCGAQRLSNKGLYPFFARTSGTYRNIFGVFNAIFKHFNWKRAAILQSRIEEKWAEIAKTLKDDLEKNQIDIQTILLSRNKHNVGLDTRHLEESFRVSVEQSHVLIICGNQKDVNQIMEAAKNLDFLKGDHVFITLDLSSTLDNPHENFNGILDIGPLTYGFNPVHDEIVKQMKLSSRKLSSRVAASSEISGYAFLLYDAVYLYALALNGSITNGENITNDASLLRLTNVSYKGLLEDVYLDESGSATPGYTIYNVINRTFVPVFDFYTSSRKLIARNISVVWPGGDILVPSGRTQCGWTEECQGIFGGFAAVISISVTLALLFSAAIITTFMKIYRAHKRKREMEKMVWKIDYHELSFRPVAGYNTKGHFGSKLSKKTFHKSSTKSIQSSISDASYGNTQVFANIASYRGLVVAVKPIRKSYMYLSKEVVIELNAIRDLSHPNVNPFIGACVEPNHICIVMTYCTKGSLQDVLENDNIKLDWLFKVSFISDIANGAEYIHNSPLKFHGRLKSSNILVDSRWSCKITDVGMRRFREGEHPASYADVRGHYQLLWTAPEHLRELDESYAGSQKGDVFSFAIIMQEIVLRGGPYCNASEDPKVIVERVRLGQPPRYRPAVSTEQGGEAMVDLMRICWEEIPAFRPNFTTVKDSIKKLNHGKQTNLVEQMMRMMEKYADHLEELVDERTRQLAEEQKRTEELLCRMIPRAVAEDLKNGKTVQPETFAQVTIFFSDIVGFTALAADSSPMQVVDFLNDLYTCFDTIIEGYDVYKVETIGDAYMVASGLPVRNGARHAGEICTMALDLLHSTFMFRVRHRPDKQLQIRIGVHSGPVVAGVVGLTMPRYCLFGDTVNYASRMESSGLALRIHVSPECKIYLDQLGGYQLQVRGFVEMKGKGSIQTYFLLGKDGFEKPLPSLDLAVPPHVHTFK